MRHALILSVFVAGLVVLVWGRVSDNPYVSDEADYMYAASLGLRANYTDSPTHSFGEFLHTGLGRGRGIAERMTLSDAIRSSGDIEFYRHWHGPVAYYWWIAASAFGLGEYGMRAAMLAFHVATLLVIYFGWLWILRTGAGDWRRRQLPFVHWRSLSFCWLPSLFLPGWSASAFSRAGRLRTRCDGWLFPFCYSPLSYSSFGPARSCILLF